MQFQITYKHQSTPGTHLDTLSQKTRQFFLTFSKKAPCLVCVSGSYYKQDWSVLIFACSWKLVRSDNRPTQISNILQTNINLKFTYFSIKVKLSTFHMLRKTWFGLVLLYRYEWPTGPNHILLLITLYLYVIVNFRSSETPPIWQDASYNAV